mmetsp:Transcript_12195/g.32279  ORF Transcript_12195/g.32279 Transcript_12195/m.32279 type:complete len:214 (+) Transcript_12195:108-749(+)
MNCQIIFVMRSLNYGFDIYFMDRASSQSRTAQGEYCSVGLLVEGAFMTSGGHSTKSSSTSFQSSSMSLPAGSFSRMLRLKSFSIAEKIVRASSGMSEPSVTPKLCALEQSTSRGAGSAWVAKLVSSFWMRAKFSISRALICIIYSSTALFTLMKSPFIEASRSFRFAFETRAAARFFSTLTCAAWRRSSGVLGIKYFLALVVWLKDARLDMVR